MTSQQPHLPFTKPQHPPSHLTTRNHTKEWSSPNLSPKLRAVFQNYFSVVTSESHFADRSTVDLCKNGDLLKLEMALRGKTALNFGDFFGEDHSLV